MALPTGAAISVRGLRTPLDSPGTGHWRAPPVGAPSPGPLGASTWPPRLPWAATPGAPSGGHDAVLLALDLEELGHAGEVLLVGLGHLLLGRLWVHNLQALGGRGGRTAG